MFVAAKNNWGSTTVRIRQIEEESLKILNKEARKISLDLS
jgi:hypothetical protein